jgi:proteasome lid subunit RPN8/RPN11
MTPHLASLRMDRTCASQMLEHAGRAFPDECVGFLAGIGGKVSLVIPLPNSAGKKSFFVEPYEQYLAEKRIKENQVDLLAIYHSHPHGCACLSETDLHFARRWNCLQVVIAIAAACDLSTQVKAFKLLPVHGQTEIPIVVD